MQDGILKQSLLSTKKAFPDDPSFQHFRMTTVYKHYILFFNETNRFILDTQKGIFMNPKIGGSGFGFKYDSFLSYWKDNTFVLFGDKSLADPDSSDDETFLFGVELLEVNEEDSQISLTVKSLNLEKKGTKCNPIQVYKDCLYVLEGFGSVDLKTFKVWKFDLNANKWSLCEIKGEAPSPRVGFATALFQNKLYILGGFLNMSGGFFAHQAARDVFALDLENMQWIKILEVGFPSLHASYRPHRSTAEVVGQKIYIQHSLMEEFTIFDPADKTIQYSQFMCPKSGWMIRSFQDRSILFRFTGGNWGKPYVEYQDFLTPTLPNQTEAKMKQAELPETQLIQTKKNILSEPSHMNLLWRDKPFSDVTFVVENEEIQAHRIILIKCHYFQNMFNSGMMEASSNKINVPDISPTNFKAILEYIYFGKIALTEQLALDLIILADMYCMAELKTDCENYLSNNLKASNLLKVIKAAETADSQSLEDRIVSFLIENISRLQQEIDLHEISHELLVKCMMKMKQKTPSSQKPANTFF